MTARLQTASTPASSAHGDERLLQRRCECGNHTPAGGLCAACSRPANGSLWRLARSHEDAAEADQVPDLVHEVLRTPGQPLDPRTRAFMEARLGKPLSRMAASKPQGDGMAIAPTGDAFEREADEAADGAMRGDAPGTTLRRDFSNVRVHTDDKAEASARAVGALAYTVGRHVVFGTGQHAPDGERGCRLMAHELAHVVQQGGSSRLQRQAALGGGLTDEMLKQVARRLRKAMAGWGTDEDAIYAAMAGRTQDQVNAIERAYRDLFGRDLGADLRDELNDSELRHLATLSPGAAPGAEGNAAEQSAGLAQMVALQLQRAIEGLGTDEESIHATLTGRTADERLAIKQAYTRATGRELEADLRDEMSGTDLAQAVLLLNQGMLEPEDELFIAMEGLGTDEDTVMRVLREQAATPGALQRLQAAYDRKYGDLIQDLRGDLSDIEYAQARQWIRPGLADADVEDCDSSRNPLQQPNTVRDAHARAFDMLTDAIRRSSNTADPQVIAMAAKHFHITLPAPTPQHNLLWIRVRRALETMARADTEATYECEPEQTFGNGACIQGNVAISLSNIHLCPLWWTSFPTLDDRAGVLVHEWGHKYGAGVNRIFEAYCHSSEFASLPAEELITLPDAYAAYVVELSSGVALPCR